MLLRHLPGIWNRFFNGRAGGVIPGSFKTLAQILSHTSPEAGEWACPTDASGCRLQWDPDASNQASGVGAWVGHLGIISHAAYAALDKTRLHIAATYMTPQGLFVNPLSPEFKYNTPHIGTVAMNAKNVLTPFSSYTIPEYVIRDWIKSCRLITDEFMLGVNWANSDNMLNFVCTWNGVIIVDGVYARPGLTGAPAVQAGQNRILDFINDMRIQGASGDVVAPRNHARWKTNYGGTIDFGSAEEYSYGQNTVNIAGGVNVVWSYYWNGSGAPQFYFDHHQAVLR